jgi:hypothetical protein
MTCKRFRGSPHDHNSDNDFQGSYLASVWQTFEGIDARFDRDRRDQLEHVAHHPVRNANRPVTVDRNFFPTRDSSGKSNVYDWETVRKQLPSKANRLIEPETGMSESFDATKIQRPDASLFRYYVFISLLSGPLAPLVLIPLWCRYATLRYNFDASGVSMCWGVIFRTEVYLTYRRIQDIHLTRNILQRWMGLATISVQTASGSSKAEMTIDGIL